MTTTTLGELTGDYVVDPVRTRIGFVAKHTMASAVPGHFAQLAGRAHLDGDDPSKSTVELRIEAASIDTRNTRRDKALREKFLDVAAHPSIVFASTTVDRAGGTTFTVTGELTVRGTTKPIAVELALVEIDDDHLAFTGTATINRRDWGVHWPPVGFLVSKTVVLHLTVTAVRQP